jgi:enamine deaminase RidA (YjgF/YER057c/UK114 family)
MSNKIDYINPDGLAENPAFSQIVTTQGCGKTIYVGGQNSININDEIVGKGDIAKQTEQVMENLQTALTACGATFKNLVKLTIYVVQGQNLYSGFQSSQKYLANLTNRPVVSVLIVAGLANPDFLIEIDAIAYIPDE